MAGPEQLVQQQILSALGAWRGLTVWRNNTGTLRDSTGRPVRFGLVGSADVLGVAAPGGRLVALEVKAPGRHPTPQQAAFGAMVQRHGGLYLVVHSLEEALVGLAEHGITP